MKKIFSILILGLVFLSFGAHGAPHWEQAWGSVGTVVVNHDQADETTKLFATKYDTGDIYRYWEDQDRWTKIGGPGKTFVATGGRLYKLAEDGSSTWRYDGEEAWTQVGGLATEIYGGGGKLYSVKPDGNIYEYTGTPGKWTMIGGPGRTFAAAGAEGGLLPGHGDEYGRAKLYGIAPDGAGVWEYSGVPEVWIQIGGPAAQIYAGGFNLYATNPDTGEIYQYQTQLPEPERDWIRIGGSARMFAVDVVGCGVPPLGSTDLYGIFPDGTGVWKYDGIPDQWEELAQPGATLAEIYVGGGEVYAVTESGRTLWRYFES